MNWSPQWRCFFFMGQLFLNKQQVSNHGVSVILDYSCNSFFSYPVNFIQETLSVSPMLDFLLTTFLSVTDTWYSQAGGGGSQYSRAGRGGGEEGRGGDTSGMTTQRYAKKDRDSSTVVKCWLWIEFQIVASERFWVLTIFCEHFNIKMGVRRHNKKVNVGVSSF